MPKETIRLLDRLVAAGFTDEDFHAIHHMPRATITVHRNYCRDTSQFREPDSQNVLVRRRLEIIEAAFRGGGFASPARTGVFAALAAAAVVEVPKT